MTTAILHYSPELSVYWHRYSTDVVKIVDKYIQSVY